MSLPSLHNEVRMVVNLKFFAGLRDALPREPFPFPAEFPEGITVADVLARYEVPPEKPRIILINGVHSDTGSPLKDGDTLSLFPPVAGG